MYDNIFSSQPSEVFSGYSYDLLHRVGVKVLRDIS